VPPGLPPVDERSALPRAGLEGRQAIQIPRHAVDVRPPVERRRDRQRRRFRAGCCDRSARRGHRHRWCGGGWLAGSDRRRTDDKTNGIDRWRGVPLTGTILVAAERPPGADGVRGGGREGRDQRDPLAGRDRRLPQGGGEVRPTRCGRSFGRAAQRDDQVAHSDRPTRGVGVGHAADNRGADDDGRLIERERGHERQLAGRRRLARGRCRGGRA
jgi:hypothetical protein